MEIRNFSVYIGSPIMGSILPDWSTGREGHLGLGNDHLQSGTHFKNPARDDIFRHMVNRRYSEIWLV